MRSLIIQAMAILLAACTFSSEAAPGTTAPQPSSPQPTATPGPTRACAEIPERQVGQPATLSEAVMEVCIESPDSSLSGADMPIRFSIENLSDERVEFWAGRAIPSFHVADEKGNVVSRWQLVQNGDLRGWVLEPRQVHTEVHTFELVAWERLQGPGEKLPPGSYVLVMDMTAFWDNTASQASRFEATVSKPLVVTEAPSDSFQSTKTPQAATPAQGPTGAPAGSTRACIAIPERESEWLESETGSTPAVEMCMESAQSIKSGETMDIRFWMENLTDRRIELWSGSYPASFWISDEDGFRLTLPTGRTADLGVWALEPHQERTLIQRLTMVAQPDVGSERSELPPGQYVLAMQVDFDWKTEEPGGMEHVVKVAKPLEVTEGL